VKAKQYDESATLLENRQASREGYTDVHGESSKTEPLARSRGFNHKMRATARLLRYRRYNPVVCPDRSRGLSSGPQTFAMQHDTALEGRHLHGDRRVRNSLPCGSTILETGCAGSLTADFPRVQNPRGVH
jgi:hypothetical protein